jgi:hypothetical protein
MRGKYTERSASGYFMRPAALTLGYDRPNPAGDREQCVAKVASWMRVDVACEGEMAALGPVLDCIDRADSGVAIFATCGWLSAAAGAALRRRGSKIHVAVAGCRARRLDAAHGGIADRYPPWVTRFRSTPTS